MVKTCNPATNAASATPGFCDLSEYLNAYGPPVGGVPSGQIYDPNTPGSNPAKRRRPLPFANNMIPIADIGQNVGNVLALFPTPTAGGVNNNFVASGAGPFDQKSFDARIDYNAPHNYQVFGRFSLDYFSLSGTGGLGALGGVGFGPGGLNGSSNVHNYSLATGFTKAIGAKWLTDFRFGYFKYNPQTAYSDGTPTPMDGIRIPWTELWPGIQGPPTTGGFSGFFFTEQRQQRLTVSRNVSTFGDGLNVGRCNCPLDRKRTAIPVRKQLDPYARQPHHQVRRRHPLRENLRVPSDQSRTGILTFDAGRYSPIGANGLVLATFLLGDVTSFQRYVSTSLNAAERQKRWFFYGQDSWRISPKFTLTYGLRWEIYFPKRQRQGQRRFC